MPSEKLPSLLLKTTSISFVVGSVLHAYLSIKKLNPFFGSRGHTFEAVVFKLVNLQLSGYFVIDSKLHESSKAGSQLWYTDYTAQVCLHGGGRKKAQQVPLIGLRWRC